MPTNLRSSRKEELVVSFISESSIKENICNIVVKIQNHSLHIAWSFLETLCVYIHVYKICMCMYMSIPIYKFCVYMQKQLQNMRFPTFIYFDLVSYPPPPCQKKKPLQGKSSYFLLITPLQICSFSKKLCCFPLKWKAVTKPFYRTAKCNLKIFREGFWSSYCNGVFVQFLMCWGFFFFLIP